jgi:hypothetical protein
MKTIQDNMEKDVIRLILRGNPVLFNQIDKANVTNRSFTGVGFFTEYYSDDISHEIDMAVGDVLAKLNQSIEVGFVLFIRKGGLITLEGYTLGLVPHENGAYASEFWPDVLESYELYVHKK